VLVVVDVMMSMTYGLTGLFDVPRLILIVSQSESNWNHDRDKLIPAKQENDGTCVYLKH
jgi:hypothetical protein